MSASKPASRPAAVSYSRAAASHTLVTPIHKENTMKKNVSIKTGVKAGGGTYILAGG
jgi:hypothetical protein